MLPNLRDLNSKMSYFCLICFFFALRYQRIMWILAPFEKQLNTAECGQRHGPYHRNLPSSSDVVLVMLDWRVVLLENTDSNSMESIPSPEAIFARLRCSRWSNPLAFRHSHGHNYTINIKSLQLLQFLCCCQSLPLSIPCTYTQNSLITHDDDKPQATRTHWHTTFSRLGGPHSFFWWCSVCNPKRAQRPLRQNDKIH